MPKRTKPLADPVTCAFTPDTGSPAPKKVALPPDGPAPSSGTVGVRLANGDVQVELGCGEDAYVYRKGDRPDFGVRPVAPGGASAPWGLP